MDISIRDYEPRDSEGVVDAYLDSSNSLRKSRGGQHPDEAIDGIINRSREETLHILLYGNHMLVAEVKGSGEIAGFGALGKRWINLFSGSASIKFIYVKERYQGGKAGVKVGSLLMEAMVEKASAMGFRKIFGYSVPEAVGFHGKSGAVFFPSHAVFHPMEKVTLLYYEICLRPSVWNGLRIEPHMTAITGHYVSLRRMLGL